MKAIGRLLFSNYYLWKLQYRGAFPSAVSLLTIGFVSLVLSIIYSSTVLTYIGLGLTLFGVLIFYILPSRYVPENIFSSISLSMIKPIDNIVTRLGYRGKTIFLHPKYLKGLTQGYIFIPYESVLSLPNEERLAKEKVFYDEPRGIFLSAPSQGLVDLFEKELNVNMATVDLQYIKEVLPRLFIEDLKIADDLSIESNGSGSNIIHVKLMGESPARLCEMVTKETKLGSHLGCPLCAALALVISKVMGKPVVIEGNVIKNDTVETSYLLLNR